MFSSKYLTIVARIRDVVVTRGDQAIIGDEECGCARIAISPSFPNLLFTVCRSSIARPLSLFDIFLNYALKCGRRSFSFGRGLGGGGGGVVCSKRWHRSQYIDYVLSYMHKTVVLEYCFRQGSVCHSKIIFRCTKTSFCASLSLKEL